MTIAQALNQSSALKPGPFADADKIAWLSQLDGQIDAEIIRTHDGAPEAAFVPYTAGAGGTDTETELLAPAPYDKMYVTFLMAQMDFYAADYDRFNNMQRRFETEYMEFATWYNRRHMPLGTGITVGKAGGDFSWPNELT